MSGGWWRRNAVPLALVAVLLPVTAGIVAANEWSEWDLGRPTKAIVVESGERVSYGGGTIGPAKAEFTTSPATPTGSRVISATVLIAPGDDPISCPAPHLRERGGAGRQWIEASPELERDFDPNRRSFCSADVPIRYSLTLDYLVPDDATGPFMIELESGDELPRFVQLIVEP